jgi:hypothetical protein
LEGTAKPSLAVVTDKIKLGLQRIKNLSSSASGFCFSWPVPTKGIVNVASLGMEHPKIKTTDQV